MLHLLLTASLSIALHAAETPTPFERKCARLAATKGHDAHRLRELFDLSWKHAMEEYPEWATEVGFPGFNDRWTDDSEAAIDRREREFKGESAALASIARAKLGKRERLDYDLFRWNLDRSLDGQRFGGRYLVISQLGGIQQDAARLLELMPTETSREYEDILARLNRLPELVGQETALLRAGLKRGVVPPKITLRDVPAQVRAQLEEDPEKNPLLAPFRKFPERMPRAEQERLRNAATEALQKKVIPEFRALLEFLEKSYVPGARESIGWKDLPDGEAWYASNARWSTTTRLTPREIHEIGLSEVARIRGEMQKAAEAAGYKGTLAEFNTFLRTSKQFFFTDAGELLRRYRDIAKRVDPELSRFFGKLPRTQYGVKAVPEYSEKSQTTAYYQQGSPRSGRPGYFFANTYALDTRPSWEMEALTLHEAVPGHHLQISLAQEMENVPEFRKHGGYTAFVEGWGLYSESLGHEMGFYADPYSRYGALTYEMWRAIRLVVDTGMHSMGWTRQRAIDFFKENSSKSEHDITVEIDRYIVWAGQALAYKIGQLRILKLREQAREKLGAKFDIRGFHDAVLANGALPLDLLEESVNEWVAASTAGR